MNDPLKTLRITVDDFNTLNKDILVLNCRAFQKKLIELQSSLTQALAEKEYTEHLFENLCTMNGEDYQKIERYDKPARIMMDTRPRKR